MNRNTIVEKLIKEGFSEKTLVKFNDKQLTSLAERILSEDESLMISKKDPQFQQKITTAKKLNKTIETYEENSKDEEKIDKKKKKKKSSEVKEWVRNLAESNYHSFTSKNEIMELISTKLNEQETMTPMPVSKPKKGHNGIPEFMTYDSIKGSEPATKPTTKPTERPKPKTPYQPGPGVNPKPKAMGESKK